MEHKQQTISMQDSDALVFFVNGNKVVEKTPNPKWTLLFYLRFKLRLVGSKEGCGEGGCGACTVMQSRYDPETKKISNAAINACLTPLCSVHGTAIITVEGIGSVKKGLHPVQERIAKSHGTQCGFCTPGFVMSMYALLRNNPKPTEQQMEEAFQGNLCRCTGYRPIMEGFKTFCSKDSSSNSSNGCCMQSGNGPLNGKCCKEYDIAGTEQVADVLFDESEFLPYDPTMEIIFPPELQLNDSLRSKSVKFTSESVTWIKPKTLTELLQLKKTHPDAKLVGGNTEIGVDVKFKSQCFPIFIQINEIPELRNIQLNDGSVTIGSEVTLATLETFCKSQCQTDNREGTVLKAIQEILKWFGGQQVRNVATIGGNLITASPISDLNPIFLAAGCTAKLVCSENSRSVKIDKNFFVSYRTTIVRPDEVLESITVPFTLQNEFIWAFKQARRREDDIAIVNSSMRVTLDTQSLTVTNASLAFGGMGPTTRYAEITSQFLVGRKWESKLTEDVMSVLSKEFVLSLDAPGGMAAYRESLVPSKWVDDNNWLGEGNVPLDPQELSAIEPCTQGPTAGVQLYQIVPQDQKVHDLIGRPLVHMSGLKHATGEAIYTDDSVPSHGELYGYLVLSKIARGRILSIDATEALKVPGVVTFMDASSIPPEKNIQGFVIDDEQVFASKEVTCQGQVIGFLVAEDPHIAESASKLVEVKYEPLKPIVTIEDAIEKESYYARKTLSCGQPGEEVFPTCDQVYEGEMRIGGQEHFYMEPQNCIATPLEDMEMDILISAQGPAYIQRQVARVLGVPANRVRVRCRRSGGAFGGKESRNVLVALSTALAAQKLNTSVRTVMNRQDDMLATGGRHPFLCRYKVGFMNDGTIKMIQANIYNNGGNSSEASPTVMDRGLHSMDAAYRIPHWDLEGFVCKTNLPSNTAFRGYGGPQGSIFCENIFDVVAEMVGKSTEEIRVMHLMKDGDATSFGFKPDNITLEKCWDEVMRNSNFQERKKTVDEFNSKNKWKKRGIAVMPMRHDIGFIETFLNQGAALVMIYLDGSVLLNHGGTEMGQGLHTKMIQVASRALDIPVEKIYFSETASDKVPNAIATCASLGSDLNGMAVIRACETLNERLAPFKKSNPSGTWENWVSAAHFSLVNLSAIGFYEMGHLSYDFKKPMAERKGENAYNYSVFGVACSEVEVDCLTGDHSVLRTDIVVDIGESLNPAIDVGQIEGAFIQGYGLFTLEELLYTPSGNMITKGPGMYKIPTMGDIPREFYVSLLRGTSNPKAVYSSKAVGEPPLFLSASIYFAIKEAIKATRKEQGHQTLFRFDCPATAERIRMACLNPFTAVKDTEDSSKKPWAVSV